MKTAMAPTTNRWLTCSSRCTNRREIRMEKRGEVYTRGMTKLIEWVWRDW